MAMAGEVVAAGDRPEDAMLHPAFDEGREPDKYRRMVSDPLACLAQAAEALDWAWSSDADVKEIRNVVALANCWMRLSVLSGQLGATTSDQH